MVLVDTGGVGLETLLNEGRVVCHPLVVGELACGTLRQRHEILSLLNALPAVVQMENEEVMLFIENHRLAAKGLGFIDMHLLASSVFANVPLWTLDKRLAEIAGKLGVGFRQVRRIEKGEQPLKCEKDS